MSSINNSELLKDKDVLAEINRYKWLESEKSRSDIGFDRASREWLSAYSKQYLAQHPGKSVLLWLRSQQLYSILNKEISLVS